MTRQEFSTLISDYRKEHGPTIKELCFKLNCMPTDIYRIEKASNNYNIQKCLNYMAAVGLCLVLTFDSKSITVITYEELLSVVIDRRIDICSQRKLSEQAGLSNITVAYYEKRKSIMTIDTLLSITPVLDITINIQNL